MSSESVNAVVEAGASLVGRPDVDVEHWWGDPARSAGADGHQETELWQFCVEDPAGTGLRLDPAWRAYIDLFAGRSDGEIGLVWRYELDGVDHNGGEFRWRHPLDIVTEPGPVLWYDGMPQAEIDRRRRMRVLEDHPYQGDGNMVLAEFLPEVDTQRLWLFDSNGVLHPASLSIPDYLTHAARLRWAFGWQVLFCDWQDDLSVELNCFAPDDLGRLFPDIDIAFYQARGEQVRRAFQQQA